MQRIFFSPFDLSYLDLSYTFRSVLSHLAENSPSRIACGAKNNRKLKRGLPALCDPFHISQTFFNTALLPRMAHGHHYLAILQYV
jgi:hypothetical protein